MKSILKIILSLIAFAFIAGSIFISAAFADNISFGVTLDRDYVEVGDMIQLGLVFEDTKSIPAPQLPEMEGIRSQYIGPTTKVTNYNGTTASSITYKYALVVLKPGKFIIGPFSFEYKGNSYTSPSKELTVVDRGQALVSKNTQGESVQGEENLEERIFVILSCSKKKAYLNEPLHITVKLYVDELNIRGIEYPDINAKGLVVEPFGQPRQYKEQLAGRYYDVVEFNTIAYASQQGALTVGPAVVKAKAVARERLNNQRKGFFEDSFFSDFFGRAKVIPIEVSSPELSLNVLGFPEHNKPKEFDSAVGDFDLKVSAIPLKLKAGDPITLTMTVSGNGNMDSIKSPELVDSQGFKLYSSEGQKKDSNVKVFEQVIIPQDQDIKYIPPVKLVFFNPEKEDYVVKQNSQIAIEVLPADEKVGVVIDTSNQSQKLSATKVLGKDILYIKENIGKISCEGKYLYENKWFIIINLLVFLVFCGIIISDFRKQRLNSDIGYARMLKAPKIARQMIQKARDYLNKGNRELFFEQVFKTLQGYLGHRFNLPAAGITAEVIEGLIVGQGLDKDIADKLKQCFSMCDLARYAAASINADQTAELLRLLENAIDYLERHK